MFKQAVKEKLRFQTSQGNLSTEDLYDLSLQNLNILAKSLSKKLKAAEEEDFLDETTKEDATTKLKFNIVIDVLNEKKEIANINKEKAEKKVQQQKLLEALEKAEGKSLENKTPEELREMLNKLNA